ncbi:hypothetical protein NEIELOOT_00599 [Neisseria elongata subsp. glycolytica ATCC 29315]|uniref:Uncharacterized protein n=1 Tax=Neisseria elongata subsp. glycolytica ATCC 29315 TaxID=546263 RepID=D4DNG8_NEIEG|nr:hypothetical protein NEIELOOT_00599 [Neisseria elongata subsp. glycolytica ATCC 29315]
MKKSLCGRQKQPENPRAGRFRLPAGKMRRGDYSAEARGAFRLPAAGCFSANPFIGTDSAFRLPERQNGLHSNMRTSA